MGAPNASGTSKRRKAGDIVWLKPHSGFVGESYKYQVEIQPEDDGDYESCWCDEPECRAWNTVWTVKEINGVRQALYHVSEHEMLDAPYSGEGL